jgi:predicted small lipoprotein YifL
MKHIGYTFYMNKFPIKMLLAFMVVCLFTAACGNKGPLVKPDDKQAESEAEAAQ